MAEGGEVLARPTGLRADSARNRDRILAVAGRRLASGTVDMSLNAIAREADVGVGTVYRHFPTVRTLVETLAADGFERLVAELRAAVTLADPAEALGAMLSIGLRSQLTDAGVAAVLAEPILECTDLRLIGEDMFAAIEDVLSRARAAGVLRSDLSPDDIRRLLVGLVTALRGAEPDAAERYLGIVLAGLRPVD